MSVAIPVQVLDVEQYDDGYMMVSFMCCFCGKKHFHGAGVKELTESTVSLGNRVPHCNEFMIDEYELRLDAWIASGKCVKR